VAIPYRRENKTTHHKYRRVVRGKDGEPNFSQDPGAPQYWFNYDCILDPTLAHTDLVITEGEFDAIAAMQAGYQRVMSVPGGAPNRPLKDVDSPKYAFVAETLTMLADVPGIVLAVDSDDPGRLLLNDLAIRLGKARCRYATYPKGQKDLNDVLLWGGVAGVQEAVKSAKWVRVEGLYRMSELPPSPTEVPHDIGIKGLNELYMARKGDLAVITGIPGHGKTSLVNDLMCRMAVHHGWVTAVASFEQNPQDDHRRALRTWCHSKPAERQSAEEHATADKWIDRYFGFLVPDEDTDADLVWLLETAAAAVKRMDADMLVVDPWNELDHVRPKDQSVTEYVAWAIRQLKKFARKFRIHVVVVAHPAKMQREKGTNKPPIPTLYDISDSAAWFNKPDIGVVVHMDGEITWARVPKVRYRDRIGRPGKVALRFNPSNHHFEDGRVE
jgi:twinkle protein